MSCSRSTPTFDANNTIAIDRSIWSSPVLCRHYPGGNKDDAEDRYNEREGFVALPSKVLQSIDVFVEMILLPGRTSGVGNDLARAGRGNLCCGGCSPRGGFDAGADSFAVLFVCSAAVRPQIVVGEACSCERLGLVWDSAALRAEEPTREFGNVQIVACKAGWCCGVLSLWQVAETVGPWTCLRDEEPVGSAESGALLPVPRYGWRTVVAS